MKSGHVPYNESERLRGKKEYFQPVASKEGNLSCCNPPVRINPRFCNEEQNTIFCKINKNFVLLRTTLLSFLITTACFNRSLADRIYNTQA